MGGLPATIGLDVSRETEARLSRFAAMVVKWNPAINLVSKASLPHLWDRHIADSVQLFRHAPPNARLWADLGAGGGFPGIVLACLAKEQLPECTFHLVESDLRKATFLMQAARSLDLAVQVAAERIETLAPLGADVVSARALAALPDLCGYALRHLRPGGMALFPKGATHDQEIRAAHLAFDFDCEIVPSVTDPAAAILILTHLKGKTT